MRVLSQDADTMVLPWGEKTHAVTKSLPFFELSGNTYVVVVYASPPLNLRLSPGERGVNTQRLAKCSHLWPSSFLSCSPVPTFHSLTLLSFS